jgi:hypothetical protein
VNAGLPYPYERPLSTIEWLQWLAVCLIPFPLRWLRPIWKGITNFGVDIDYDWETSVMDPDSNSLFSTFVLHGLF